MGTFFHPECFCCRACGHPITEHEVISSSWLPKDSIMFFFLFDLVLNCMVFEIFKVRGEVTIQVMMIRLLPSSSSYGFFLLI